MLASLHMALRAFDAPREFCCVAMKKNLAQARFFGKAVRADQKACEY
jgi:hypothetical protein